ncbi:MAG TPA: ABC transporter substrate-binding protein [Sporichthya sp.]|nr:ABC transporter substrate-binding protein [Sporichthya sp.]
MALLRRTRTVGALMLALALPLAACGGGGDDNTKPDAAAAKPSAAAALTFGVDDQAVGPAPAIEGAVSGGTVRVLDDSDVAHLDPARVYVTTYNLVTNLISRTLTGYRQNDGKVTLVGDLATNTGVTKDGGKTWTYTLRDGVTWEDGSTLTSADVKYGLERTFEAGYSEGPVYLQEWITGQSDFRKIYAGPYSGKALDAIKTPDAKTVVLKLAAPHPDLPFALALASGAPVKKSEDTRAKYDQRPFASGPYKIASRKIDKSMTLVRNTAWKPDSDPLHYQYPNSYEFQWGEQRLGQYQRLIAANGGDAAAVPLFADVPPELLAQVTGSPDLMALVRQDLTPFVYQFSINVTRVPDLEVRKALLQAFPKQQIRQISGGPPIGDLATTLGGPTLVGHQPDDIFGIPPQGDPAKAKATLQAAGKLGQKIVYAYAKTDTQQKIAVAVAQAWTDAGFQVVKKEISDKNFYDEIGQLDNKFDVYETGWGFDWPSGASVYVPLFDSGRVAEQGTNYGQFKDPAVDKEIKRILALTDQVAAGKAWAALDRTLLAKVPAIPYLYIKNFMLTGPKIGNAHIDLVLGSINLNGLYVKP